MVKKFLIVSMLLLMTGCSEPEVIVVDRECMDYYTGRIGLVYAQEVC